MTPRQNRYNPGPMSSKRPDVPEEDAEAERTPSPTPEGEAAPERRGLRRPFVAGGPVAPEAASEPEEAHAARDSAGEDEEGYIEFDFDTLLAPGEIPAVLREESGAGAPVGDRPAASSPAGTASNLFGVGEELLRLRRQIELRREQAKLLAQLQDEAESPATRDLIEAAFAAGYFAGKGELERRVGHLLR